MKNVIRVCFAACLLLVVGCNRGSAPTDATVRDRLVTFLVQLEVEEAGEVIIDLGVYNGGDPLPPDEAFNGRYQLLDAAGEMVIAGDMPELPAITGEEMVIMHTVPLSPGAYTVTWGAPNYGATVVDFEVEAADEGIRLGEQHIFNTADYPPDS